MGSLAVIKSHLRHDMDNYFFIGERQFGALANEKYGTAEQIHPRLRYTVSI
jgi:hypothetical protein